MGSGFKEVMLRAQQQELCLESGKRWEGMFSEPISMATPTFLSACDLGSQVPQDLLLPHG